MPRNGQKQAVSGAYTSKMVNYTSVRYKRPKCAIR